MNSRQLAVYGGIAYTLAILVWTMGQMSLDTDPVGSALAATEALLLTQYLLVLFLVPWLAEGEDRYSTLASILMLIIIPIPLFLILVLSTDIEYPGIIASQLVLLGLTLVCYGLASILMQITRSQQGRRTGITLLQILTVSLVWASGDHWINGYIT